MASSLMEAARTASSTASARSCASRTRVAWSERRRVVTGEILYTRSPMLGPDIASATARAPPSTAVSSLFSGRPQPLERNQRRTAAFSEKWPCAPSRDQRAADVLASRASRGAIRGGRSPLGPPHRSQRGRRYAIRHRFALKRKASLPTRPLRAVHALARARRRGPLRAWDRWLSTTPAQYSAYAARPTAGTPSRDAHR